MKNPLDPFKLGACYANDKLNMAQIMAFVYESFENFVSKGENAAYQHFVFFPWCYPNLTSFRESLVKG